MCFTLKSTLARIYFRSTKSNWIFDLLLTWSLKHLLIIDLLPHLILPQRQKVTSNFLLNLKFNLPFNYSVTTPKFMNLITPTSASVPLIFFTLAKNHTHEPIPENKYIHVLEKKNKFISWPSKFDLVRAY